MRRGLRAIYQLLDTRAAVLTARGAAAALGALTGSTADGWLSAFDRRFVRSGWPGHTTNWVNHHTSRFLTRVRRSRSNASGTPLRRDVPPCKLQRVGLVGKFVGTLAFPAELFAAAPAHLAGISGSTA